MLFDGFGLLLFAFWPVIVPFWVWTEISAKKLREQDKERKRIDAEQKLTNPNYGLSMDEQIDKLRSIHNELNKTK